MVSRLGTLYFNLSCRLVLSRNWTHYCSALYSTGCTVRDATAAHHPLPKKASLAIATATAMPRPRVTLENRKRTYHACLLCKASKVKCNSELPCSACIKRGRDAACLYSDTERRRTPRPLPQAHRQQPQQQQQDSALHPPNSPSPIPTPPALITNNGEEPNAFSPKATSANPLRGNS
jgi:hypothetical protein